MQEFWDKLWMEWINSCVMQGIYIKIGCRTTDFFFFEISAVLFFEREKSAEKWKKYEFFNTGFHHLWDKRARISKK